MSRLERTLEVTFGHLLTGQDVDPKEEARVPILRLKVTINGAVQGVGYRPFVFRLATELGLSGWIRNSSQGVILELEGYRPALDEFLARVETEKPPRSFIQSLESSFLDPFGYDGFRILPSHCSQASNGGPSDGSPCGIVLPDIAICDECREEVFDPGNRRYLYPFTNCTNCGPRFSIIRSLPYDRSRTTMSGFQMCRECLAEYEDPQDRRFHAQPNACAGCGPRLELWDGHGRTVSAGHAALLGAADALRGGNIVAVKGLGGFHLMVDARLEGAVVSLRQRKRRDEKPFAVMFPSLEWAGQDCVISGIEQRLLLSPASPIVLVRRRTGDSACPRETNMDSKAASDPCAQSGPSVACSVAPDNPLLAVLLPYTPLHCILMAELGFPVVATSGNIADEPICTDEHQAIDCLAGIADLFLVHDRPILRHVDDSIVRVLGNREAVMRRARGYAPLPVSAGLSLPRLLSLGGHMKNTIAVSSGEGIFVSQHIGDLDTLPALKVFRKETDGLKALCDVRPVAVACDLHPDYASTRYAAELGLPVVRVQHHYAHVMSCAAENELVGSADFLGVAWDGTGYGTDGTVWGGEFLLCRPGAPAPFERVGHLRTFGLPGGEAAVREPRRAALGVLYEMMGDPLFELREPGSRGGALPPMSSFTDEESRLIQRMLQRKLNTPMTSSAGRLFDAVASITGLCQHNGFEGQAAMQLEFALDGIETEDAYPMETMAAMEANGCGNGVVTHVVPLIVDWGPAVETMLDDLYQGTAPGLISGRFHNGLADSIASVALRVGEERVVLTGGCFQNRYLLERTVRRLREEGLSPYWHQRVPPNDGGLALGQLVAAALTAQTKAWAQAESAAGAAAGGARHLAAAVGTTTEDGAEGASGQALHRDTAARIREDHEQCV